MRRRNLRSVIAMIAGLALVLSGCGDDDPDAGQPVTEAEPAEGAGAGPVGTISVDIDSGPLAGTHGGVGSLTCAHGKFGGDDIWLVFSDDIDDTNDLTVVNVYSAPEGEKDNVTSPYQGQAFVLEVGIGNFMADATKKVTINGDNPGTPGTREIQGNTIHVGGTSHDGIKVDVSAHCETVETS